MLDSANYFYPALEFSMNTADSHFLMKLSQICKRMDTPKNRRRGQWLLGSFVVLVLLGFFVLPPNGSRIMLNVNFEYLAKKGFDSWQATKKFWQR